MFVILGSVTLYVVKKGTSWKSLKDEDDDDEDDDDDDDGCINWSLFILFVFFFFFLSFFFLFFLDRLLVCFLTKTLGQDPSSGLALPW